MTIHLLVRLRVLFGQVLSFFMAFQNFNLVHSYHHLNTPHHNPPGDQTYERIPNTIIQIISIFHLLLCFLSLIFISIKNLDTL